MCVTSVAAAVAAKLAARRSALTDMTHRNRSGPATRPPNNGRLADSLPPYSRRPQTASHPPLVDTGAPTTHDHPARSRRGEVKARAPSRRRLIRFDAVPWLRGGVSRLLVAAATMRAQHPTANLQPCGLHSTHAPNASQRCRVTRCLHRLQLDFTRSKAIGPCDE